MSNVPQPNNDFINRVVNGNYLKVMGLLRDQVELVYVEHTGIDGQQFVVMLDSTTGVPLAVYADEWEKSTLGFWGKQVGIEIGTDAYFASPSSDEMKLILSFGRATFGVGGNWKGIEPRQNEYNMGELKSQEKAYNALIRNGVNDIIIHAAIFPGDLPDWLHSNTFSQDELREIMKKRIQFLIDKNPHATFLVVVNEPYQADNPGRKDPFYDAWGGYEYIVEAFQIAKAYSESQNRDIKLIYNDSDNHYAIGSTSNISRQIVRMLHEKGLIDYVGMQTHIGEWRERAFDELMIPQMPQEIEFYKQLGVPVLITELSYQPDSNSVLSDYKMTISQDEFERNLSHVYEAVFRIAIESGNVHGVTFWGLTDKYYKLDNVNWYGIFDEYGQPKQSYYIVLRTLYEGMK